MTDPSKTSVNLQISENLAPLHHCKTTSIISILKDWTYSSSTIAMPDSFETFDIRRAVSWSCRRGVANSSLRRTWVSDCGSAPASEGRRGTHLFVKDETSEQGGTVFR